jgi:hypothetical protein
MRRKTRMRWTRIRLAVRVIAMAGLALVATSNQAKAIKLLAPTRFGMEAIGGNVYVERAMSAGQREDVLRMVKDAQQTIRRVYGGVASDPWIVCCSTEERFRAFGGTAQRGVSYGPYALLLAPRGLTLPILSHEWSHAELYRRLGLWSWRRVPQWFDEGLAVAVGEEPSHSEAVYQQARREGVPIPALSGLVSDRQWRAAARRYGDSRLNPHHLRVVYATAGHEVRPWLEAVKTTGLLWFVQRMRSGVAFDGAYAAARERATRGGQRP